MDKTIGDVAREAGVSISTVSRVLNGNYPVSAGTKEKVLAAVKKLNFTPNSLARGLVIKQTLTIGVITPSITNLYFSLIIGGIQSCLKKHGYQMIICNTEGNPDQERDYLHQLINRRVDGIISINPRTISVKNGVYEELRAALPLILINGYSEGVKLNYVLSDQSGGALSALNYLKSLGHRRIAFVRGGPSYSYDLKEKVYKEFMLENNLPLSEKYIVHLAATDAVDMMEGAALSVQRLLSTDPQPTAVFACNDWMGAGIIRGAGAAGVSIPGELSVIGYDNTVISEITVPKLSTVDQNMALLGQTASEQLLNLLDKKDRTQGYSRYILDTNLVERESCSPLK